jgi:hypothetical protein
MARAAMYSSVTTMGYKYEIATKVEKRVGLECLNDTTKTEGIVTTNTAAKIYLYESLCGRRCLSLKEGGKV